ncbi:helix-turn-helix domain-containing protein [Nocardia sp. NPDC058058]|uniref:helix-turn-helix domain-containing protein n=1 Tax=Nocardia sp. NPDC058058 TaxID=3346317 RepID=UPI0036D8480E
MPADPLPETCYPATVWLGPGYAVYLGPSLRLDPHSGSVHCLVIGVDAPFTLRIGDHEEVVRSALIPPRTTHQVIAGGERMLFHYIDPVAMDTRITAALKTIRADIAMNPAAAELAADANLSVSRFLHLFSAETGTSFRRYRNWARMAQVMRAVAAGADFTTAAVDAGFASPSHFSDTFHAMFGLTAGALLPNTRFVVCGDEP